MNIDMNTIRWIVRRSLQESRGEALPDNIRASRATFHALKGMYLLNKDVPLPANVEVTGTSSEALKQAVGLLVTPEFATFARLVPAIVHEEMSREVQA